MRAGGSSNPPVEWSLLNAEANVESRFDRFRRARCTPEELVRRGIVFAMASVKQDLRDLLQAAGLLPKIGEYRIFMTLPTAVEAFNRR
jgi:sulfate permease, SulP family